MGVTQKPSACYLTHSQCSKNVSSSCEGLTPTPTKWIYQLSGSINSPIPAPHHGPSLFKPALLSLFLSHPSSPTLPLTLPQLPQPLALNHTEISS